MRSITFAGIVCGGIAVISLALTTEVLNVPQAKPCTRAWFQYLDDYYMSGLGSVFDADDDGGKPDLGGSEWFNGFERTAKIAVPTEFSKQQGCEFIQKTLRERTYIVNKMFGWVFILKARED